MLNYIWLSLLALGILTALFLDLNNSAEDKYKNYKPITVTVKEIQKNSKEQFEAEINIEKNNFNVFYNTKEPKEIIQKAKLKLNYSDNYYSVYFLVDNNSPKIWKEIAGGTGKEEDINGKLWLGRKKEDGSYSAWLVLESVSFIKMKDITNAAISYSTKAVEIAIGLIGIMALWLGIMKIAEQAGLISIIAKSVKPITKFLFPDVPQDHPAIGSIIMNMSANMLGLGNAATPFGLKAMEELDQLNTNKGTATNAMCTFLAINTAGLTLIPATAIAIRAASGSSDPAIIIGTSMFGALCATLMGIMAVKILEKFPMSFSQFVNYIKSSWKFLFVVLLFVAAIVILLISGLSSQINFLSAEAIKSVIQIISIIAIPFIIFSFVAFGIIKKVKIYETFVEGAKEGFNIAVRIIPFLVAMLVAIGIFRAGGAMELLMMVLSPVTNLIGFPAEALPMALMRPLSGSGSLGIMSEILTVHGPDSFIGILVSTIMGSTETTFYVLALYFGSVNISKMRHAVAAGLIADIAGILGALLIVSLLFG